MLTFTFAGDESGDASFNFVKGASRYFVVAVIATQSPDSLRSLLEKLRKDSRLSERYEFGYHKLSSEQLRKYSPHLQMRSLMFGQSLWTKSH